MIRDEYGSPAIQPVAIYDDDGSLTLNYRRQTNSLNPIPSTSSNLSNIPLTSPQQDFPGTLLPRSAFANNSSPSFPNEEVWQQHEYLETGTHFDYDSAFSEGLQAGIEIQTEEDNSRFSLYRQRISELEARLARNSRDALSRQVRSKEVENDISRREARLAEREARWKNKEAVYRERERLFREREVAWVNRERRHKERENWFQDRIGYLKSELSKAKDSLIALQLAYDDLVVETVRNGEMEMMGLDWNVDIAHVEPTELRLNHNLFSQIDDAPDLRPPSPPGSPSSTSSLSSLSSIGHSSAQYSTWSPATNSPDVNSLPKISDHVDVDVAEDDQDSDLGIRRHICITEVHGGEAELSEGKGSDTLEVDIDDSEDPWYFKISNNPASLRDNQENSLSVSAPIQGIIADHNVYSSSKGKGKAQDEASLVRDALKCSSTSTSKSSQHPRLSDCIATRPEIFVDASGYGIGIILDGRWLAYRFGHGHSGIPVDSHKQVVMSWAELIAVELGIHTLVKAGYRNTKILVRSDNSGVVTALLRKTWTDSYGLNGILAKIISLCREHGLDLGVRWVWTKMNPADGPSRGIYPPAQKMMLDYEPEIPDHLSGLVQRVICV